ncbi:hypothetical protein GCM10022232_28300 [Streptomyces plumbiresistens]|uniref:Transposase n=1 Tax=Streptomyces plumbiresistens TaxID=511811 RepID=A0ABP7R343_9ACTN
MLVERSTRFSMLIHLPADHTAVSVRDALQTTVQALPPRQKRSVTWDQCSKMAARYEFTVATNVPVYFCDPASPWRCGSNDNTNGQLRQYFPKSTDLFTHTREEGPRRRRCRTKQSPTQDARLRNPSRASVQLLAAWPTDYVLRRSLEFAEFPWGSVPVLIEPTVQHRAPVHDACTLARTPGNSQVEGRGARTRRRAPPRS